MLRFFLEDEITENIEIESMTLEAEDGAMAGEALNVGWSRKPPVLGKSAESPRPN
jgi:hypothetical protein